MADVYRTDQIGSLVRPPALLDARDGFRAGRMNRLELAKVEDQAILEALELQRSAGIDVFGDGEFRRDAYLTGMSRAIGGFVADYPLREHTKEDGTVVRVVQHAKPISGKVSRVARIAQNEAAFLKVHAPGPFKITLTSPAAIARRSYKPGMTDKPYPDPDVLLDELTDIISDEMHALADEGVPCLQLDQGFADYARVDWLEKAAAQKLDIEEQLHKDMAAENACYAAARRDGVTLAMHACRGNRTSFVSAKGGYDWLAERLFDGLDVDQFLLEYDSARAGGFEPLRFLPKGKVVVLGLVSSKNSSLETRDELLRRIDEAAKYCSVEQLALSAQCGFQGAADRDGAFMSLDQQKRKLELIARTAETVWH